MKAIPLGGLGEFGMNMMAFEFDDDVIIVDCGVMFPDAELLGVDIVIPDLTYVRTNRERIRAILPDARTRRSHRRPALSAGRG